MDAGKLLGAGALWVMLDHLLIGQGRWVSLREPDSDSVLRPHWAIITSMDIGRQKQLADALEGIVSTLVAQYQPEKIILFGSMVDDTVEQWSDIDLVIIKDTPLPFFQRLKEVALLCRAPVGVDYLVYTPDELDQMVAQNNHFLINEVIGKGKIIYERQPAEAVAYSG